MSVLFFQVPPLPDVPTSTDGILLLIGLGLAYAVFQNAGTGLKALIARYQSGTDAQIMQTSAFKLLMARLDEAERKANEAETQVSEMKRQIEVLQTQLATISNESAAKDRMFAAKTQKVAELEADKARLEEEVTVLKGEKATLVQQPKEAKSSKEE